MKAFNSSVFLVFGALLLSAVLNAALSAKAIAASDPVAAFLPESQVLQQLPALEQDAVAQQKLLLVVLGSSWCHDSVALVEQFNQPVLATPLQQRFNIVMVDVGYLQYGRNVAQRYQLPIYYGTPTVMVVNPATGQLLNKADLMHWTNAASLPAEQYLQYFLTTDFSADTAQLTAIAPEQLQQINRFEQQQADKLAGAYQHLGRLLAAYKTSGAPATDEFKQVWDEVKQFRSAILPAVLQLQQQAKRQSAGSDLLLPTYPAFSFNQSTTDD